MRAATEFTRARPFVFFRRGIGRLALFLFYCCNLNLATWFLLPHLAFGQEANPQVIFSSTIRCISSPVDAEARGFNDVQLFCLSAGELLPGNVEQHSLAMSEASVFASRNDSLVCKSALYDKESGFFKRTCNKDIDLAAEANNVGISAHAESEATVGTKVRSAYGDAESFSNFTIAVGKATGNPSKVILDIEIQLCRVRMEAGKGAAGFEERTNKLAWSESDCARAVFSALPKWRSSDGDSGNLLSKNFEVSAKPSELYPRNRYSRMCKGQPYQVELKIPSDIPVGADVEITGSLVAKTHAFPTRYKDGKRSIMRITSDVSINRIRLE